jgi:hypothetical protein
VMLLCVSYFKMMDKLGFCSSILDDLWRLWIQHDIKMVKFEEWCVMEK